MNKLAKNFEIKDGKPDEAAGNKVASDKIPEAAKLVVDDEKLSKELTDLKRRLKEIHLENKKI